MPSRNWCTRCWSATASPTRTSSASCSPPRPTSTPSSRPTPHGARGSPTCPCSRRRRSTSPSRCLECSASSPMWRPTAAATICATCTSVAPRRCTPTCPASTTAPGPLRVAPPLSLNSPVQAGLRCAHWDTGAPGSSGIPATATLEPLTEAAIVRGRPGPTWKISVNVPREKAYAYVADVGRHGEWGSAADSMTITADQPGDPAVGKTYSATGILLGKPNTSKVTITALEPPERVEFEYEDSRGTGGHVFTFTPEGGGTLITR